jgi:hypothetical protein
MIFNKQNQQNQKINSNKYNEIFHFLIIVNQLKSFTLLMKFEFKTTHLLFKVSFIKQIWTFYFYFNKKSIFHHV